MKPAKCIGNKFQLRHVMHPLVIDIIEAADRLHIFMGGLKWFYVEKTKTHFDIYFTHSISTKCNNINKEQQ